MVPVTAEQSVDLLSGTKSALCSCATKAGPLLLL